MVMSIPGNRGISGKAGSKPRIHVAAHEWGSMPFATDFWFYPHADILTASAPQLLTSLGWISNGTLSVVAGSGADFLSSTDRGTPTHLLCNASGERLTSPFIFGGDFVTRFIKDQLGWTPRKLIADFAAIWTTSSNADTTGGIGFVEAGGAIQTANDHLAVITSDGTNYVLRSGGSTSDAALAVDTNAHLWKIVIDMGQQLVFFYQDGIAIDSIALETDLFPAAFGVATTSSNVLGLGAGHLYYD